MTNKTNLNGINVYTKGHVKNKSIVFIHGNSLNALTFKKQFENLKDIPMVAIDLPGHGLSEHSENFENIYCLPGYISALKKIIEELELQNYILIGHSLGGHIAIEALEVLNDVKGLMVFGTPPIGIPPAMDKMYLPNPLMAHFFSKEISETDANLLSNELVYNNPTIAAELKNYILQTDGNARINLGASIGKGQFKNEIEIVKALKIPIAILHGEKDSLVNLNYIKELYLSGLCKSETITMPNIGHTPQIENSELFNKYVLDFYNSIFCK